MSNRIIGANPVLGAAYIFERNYQRDNETTEEAVARLYSVGRFSCSAPQPQNICKTELPKGLTIDYSKLEERAFAFYSSFGNDLSELCTDVVRETDVLYARSHRATVLENYPDGRVKIKFANPKLIPNEMEVRPFELAYVWGGPYVNPQLECPKCHVAWKETPGFRFSFFDCPQCGAKKEDYAR
jgi:hypothetical protein